MMWPWVSRLAYDAVCSERDRLREQNDKLLDHVARMDRVEHGLTEQSRPVKPALEPMPMVLRDYIAGFANQSIQKTMRDQAYRRHAAGVGWDMICGDMIDKEKE